MNNNELMHYNIKGSKWGQRRFQNKDGSLTPAGRERYGVGNGKKNGVSALDKLKIKRKAAANKKGQPVKKQVVKKKSPEQIKKEQEAAREAKRKEVLASRSAKTLYDNANLFTTEELRAAKERLMLERDIKALEPKTISKGEARVQKIKKGMDLASGVMDSGIKLWNNTARLYNSLTDSGRENPLPIIKDKGDQSMTKKAKDARQKKAEEQEQRQREKEAQEKADAKAKKKAEKQAKKDAKKFNEYTDDSGPWSGNVEGVGRSKAERFFDDDFDDFVDGVWRDVSSAAKSPQAAIGQNYVMALLEDKKKRR